MKQFKYFPLYLFSLVLLAFSTTKIHAVLPGGCMATKEPLNFYEKMAEINDKLYTISAGELQEFLGCYHPNIPIISAQDLKNIMYDANNLPYDTNFKVINVLPKTLFDDCHIATSESVPLKELVDKVSEWPRDQPIIVYCALDICDAGQKAYVLLTCMGFTNVVDYEGGIKEWYQLGYPTEGPADCNYLHAKYAKLPDELISELSECCGIEVPRENK